MPEMNMGNKLYTLLPEIYKMEDANISPNPYPLKRYLQVLGGGMDALASGLTDYGNLKNVDKCPDELLDILATFYDFKFPANTSNEVKRRILKVLPLLFQNKGTSQAFLYLTRAMFGVTSDIEITTPKYYDGISAEELRRILVKIQIDDKVTNVDSKMVDFENYTKIIRPVNRKIIVTLSTLFTDKWDSGWANEEELISRLTTTYFMDDSTKGLNSFIVNKDKTVRLGFLHNIHSQDYLTNDIINLKLIEESYNLSGVGKHNTKLNKNMLNSEFNTMTHNIVIDKIKQVFDYQVDLNVTESDVTRFSLDVAYSKFKTSGSKLNRDNLTSASLHHSLNTTEEITTRASNLESSTFNFNRPTESYSKLNKSKLNGGLVLTHKTHYDTIKIKGVIQQII